MVYYDGEKNVCVCVCGGGAMSLSWGFLWHPQPDQRPTSHIYSLPRRLRGETIASNDSPRAEES